MDANAIRRTFAKIAGRSACLPFIFASTVAKVGKNSLFCGNKDTGNSFY